MPKDPPGPLQTTYRLAVMVGTLACGSLGAYQYGPPPERLAEMIDAGAERLGLVEDAGAPEPAQLATSAGLEQPPRFDPAVQLASGEAPIASAQATGPVSAETLLAPVLAAGAVRADFREIGLGADRVYQAIAAVPAAPHQSDLVNQVDALGETPAEAAAALTAKVRSLPRR